MRVSILVLLLHLLRLQRRLLELGEEILLGVDDLGATVHLALVVDLLSHPSENGVVDLWIVEILNWQSVD